MSTPFILSARSKDLELKGITTVRIPGYIADDGAGATGSRTSTESDQESETSSRAPSPSGDDTRDGGKSAGVKAPVGLGMAPLDGWKTSHIDFGGGSAAAQKAKKKSAERRRHRKGRQPPPGAGAGKPLFGALTMAPLAQVFKDGDTQPPTAADVALVFTPTVAQHLFGDPVGPGGQPCDGFNQPLLLEFPLLEPPLSSKCNCIWSGRG
jgi:hypothetical protein